MGSEITGNNHRKQVAENGAQDIQIMDTYTDFKTAMFNVSRIQKIENLDRGQETVCSKE